MNDSEFGATCSDCRASRSKKPGPCPECGSRNRTMGVGRAEETNSAGSIGVSKGISVGIAEETDAALPVWIRNVREFPRRHPWWTAAGVAAFLIDLAISVLAPALGPVVGTAATIALGVVGFVAGEKSTILVREIEERAARG